MAYECDDRNTRIGTPSPTRLGSSENVCVTPDKESSLYGMTMNRIDSWNWTLPDDGASQVSAKFGGEQAEDGLSILVCVPGATMCIIRTQYTCDFYKFDGSAVGVGDVVLQFTTLDWDEQVSSLFRRRNLGDGAQAAPRQLQLVGEPIIAGAAREGIDVRVAKRRNKDLPEHCKYEQKVTGRWKEEPAEDKYMYIVGVVLECSPPLPAPFLYAGAARAFPEGKIRMRR